MIKYKNTSKLIGTHEIKVGDVWYKIVGLSSDEYVMYGISISGEERRIPTWRNEKIRRI